MLKEMAGKDISTDSIGAVLRAVHLETLTTFTMYSNFADLKAGKIYLSYMSQYQELSEIDMAEELTKGQRIIKMSDLFSEETVTAGDKAYAWFETRFKLAIAATIAIGLTLAASIIFHVAKKVRNNS